MLYSIDRRRAKAGQYYRAHAERILAHSVALPEATGISVGSYAPLSSGIPEITPTPVIRVANKRLMRDLCRCTRGEQARPATYRPGRTCREYASSLAYENNSSSKSISFCAFRDTIPVTQVMYPESPRRPIIP